MSAPWWPAYHTCTNPHALVPGYWTVTDGTRQVTVPDALIAADAAAFYNRVLALGYEIDLLPTLLTASWIDA